MCRHIYNWNIVDCDVKQPMYTHSLTPQHNGCRPVNALSVWQKVHQWRSKELQESTTYDAEGHMNHQSVINTSTLIYWREAVLINLITNMEEMKIRSFRHPYDNASDKFERLIPACYVENTGFRVLVCVVSVINLRLGAINNGLSM